MATVSYQIYNSNTGDVRSFTLNCLCLRLMGKSPERMESIAKCIPKGYVPLTCTFEDAGEGVIKSPLTIELAEKVLGNNPSMRTCLTPVSEIFKTGKATFDIANYSYNEVMHCMFHIRLLINSTAPYQLRGVFKDKVSLISKGSFGIMVMEYLVQKYSCTWWQAYLFIILTNSKDGYHLPMNDGSCFTFKFISVKELGEWVAGKLIPAYDDKKLTDLIKAKEGYVHNMVSLLCENINAKPSCYDLIMKLNSDCNASATQDVDLFGNPFSTEVVQDVDPIRVYLDGIYKAFNKFIGEDNA